MYDWNSEEGKSLAITAYNSYPQIGMYANLAHGTFTEWYEILGIKLVRYTKKALYPGHLCYISIPIYEDSGYVRRVDMIPFSRIRYVRESYPANATHINTRKVYTHSTGQVIWPVGIANTHKDVWTDGKIYHLNKKSSNNIINIDRLSDIKHTYFVPV